MLHSPWSRRVIPSTVIAVALALLGTVLLIAGSPDSAQAASLVGKPCKKVGTTMGDGPGRTVICTKLKSGKKKGKLVWKLSKGTNPGPGPGPNPDPACKTRPVFTKDFIAPEHVQVVVPIDVQE